MRFDANLTFDPHVRNTVKVSFFHLRNIAKRCPMLTFSVAEKLINTFVFSRIDYCNALLAGVSKATLSKLQLVQNSAARILTRTSAREHLSWKNCTSFLLVFVLILKFSCSLIRP